MTRRRPLTMRAVGTAAAVGGVHTAATVYWACGGTRLIGTLGDTIVDEFAGRMWLLWPVAVVKLVAAIAPALLLRRTAPPRRPVRLMLGTTSATLIMWGGVNTAIGNLVLTHVVRPTGGYDREAMIGHAWLWDPLFLAWGASLAIALVCTRPIPSRQRRRASISRRT